MDDPACRDPACRAGLCLLLLALALPGCSGDPTVPDDDDDGGGPAVATIQVVSPVDSVLARGRTAQLTATARDAQGNTLPSTQFTWMSSAAPVTVSAGGLATAAATGTSTVTAAATGSTVTGSITLRVVNADLDAVAALAADPFPAALVAALSSATRPAIESAWSDCATGAGSGNIMSVRGCVAAVRAGAAAAADGNNRSLLAVLTLFADQVERLLDS